MAARKAKDSAKGRARKKRAKQAPVRGTAKAAKRTRRPSTTKGAAKSPRTAVAPTVPVATVTPAQRKPVKKAEPRPSRPPAVLPIPQATFFF
jgi:hypothetical protein